MSSTIWANVTVQGTLTTAGTFGQTTFAPVDLGAYSLSLATGNLTSSITTSSSAPTAFTANNAGEGSLVFPGTANAYISFGTSGQPFSNSNIYAFGDFVVEAWVNPTSLSNSPVIVGYGDPFNTGQNQWQIGVNGSSQMQWYSYLNSVGSAIVMNATIPTGTWSHIAVIHQSASKRIQMYLNGQPQTLASASGGFTGSGTIGSYTTGIVPVTGQPLVVGQLYQPVYVYNGYLTNLRITTGSGAAQIYNNNAFTPQTSPLFPASNTAGGSLTTRLLVRVPLSQGKFQTQKHIGPPATGFDGVQAYPPAPMSAYMTDLTGLSPYGGGKYVASASSENTAGGGYYTWRAFDKAQSGANPYSSTGSLYAVTTGLYTGTVRTVDTSGNSYTGEWLQLQIPVSIVISSYIVQQRQDGYGNGNGEPTSWAILGSNDGTNWTLVDQRIYTAWAGTGSAVTFSATSQKAFSFYRFVASIVGSTGATNNLCIGEWTLNGQVEGTNFTSDGRLGVGVVNPTRALEVAGDVISGGTVSSVNPLMYRNRIINGDLRVSQRGTSFTIGSGGTNGAYTLDRWAPWMGSNVGTATWLFNQSSIVPPGYGFSNSVAITVSSVPTSYSWSAISQPIEGYNVADLGWGTAYGSPITISFWAKTSVAGVYGVLIIPNGSAPGGPTIYGAQYTLGGVNAWQYITINVPPPPTGTTLSTTNSIGMSINFGLVNLDNVGNLNGGTTPLGWSTSSNRWAVPGQANWGKSTSDYFYITGVQLEKGLVATPFEFRPYATELALCQRYYYQLTSPVPGSTGVASTVFALLGSATGINSTTVWIPLYLPVTMRTAGLTITNSAGTNWQLYNGTTINLTTLGVQSDSYTTNGVILTGAAASGVTSGTSYVVRTASLTGSTTAYVGVSAEL